MRMISVGPVLAVLLALAPGSSAAAGGQPALASPSPLPPVASVAAGNTDFAFRLYHQLRPQPGNLFFSPYSISLALAMTYAGARGNTEREMAQAMGFQLPQDQLHPAFRALSQELASRAQDQGALPDDKGEPFRLHIANSLWGQQGHPFLPEFLDLPKEEYGAGIQLVSFAQAEAARETINRWVSTETQGKITDLIQPEVLDRSTRLVLANAVYFRASWEGRFERGHTVPGPFTLLDGGKVTVPLMHQSIYGRAAEGEGWQAVELPYRGRKVAMLIVVPSAGTFSQFEMSLTPEAVQAILSALKVQDVNVTLPRFGCTSSFQLDEALIALGMRDAFGGGADFSGMDGMRVLSIGAAVHRGMVNVNEEGTEAAAATAVLTVCSARTKPPLEVKVDRPFLFLIRDIPTGTILFMGRVVDPRGDQV